MSSTSTGSVPFNVQNLNAAQPSAVNPNSGANNPAATPDPPGPIVDNDRIQRAEGQNFLIAGYEKIEKSSVGIVDKSYKDEIGPPRKITFQIKARTYPTHTPSGQPTKARDRIWEVTLSGDCANLVVENGNVDLNKQKAFVDRYVAALVVQDQITPSKYFHRATHAFVSQGANGEFHVRDVELENYLLPKWLWGRKHIHESHIHSKIIKDNGQLVVSANPNPKLPQNEPEIFQQWLQDILNGKAAAAAQQQAAPPALPPPGAQQPALNVRQRAQQTQAQAGNALRIDQLGSQQSPSLQGGNAGDKLANAARDTKHSSGT